MEIPEEVQAAALRKVAEIGQKRAQLLAQAAELMEPLREASVHAAKVGAGRNRIKDYAQVSPNTLYGWLESAGIEVRAKAPAKTATTKKTTTRRSAT
ncbi:hypothetical protein ACIBCA_37025 [Kitasatospora sp. NPDC051170]|uniref:hypothetical protein n=1 Tax=Kitasatospora sp. NPDC051170 TaxID=3364056 RepID=UPI0037B1C96F